MEQAVVAATTAVAAEAALAAALSKDAAPRRQAVLALNSALLHDLAARSSYQAL
jgi:hypothetical protein